MTSPTAPPKLWQSHHPYYATDGCYYVSHSLGHQQTGGGWDGNTCHSDYASWEDFKNGDEAPFPAETQEARRRHGVKEPTPEEVARQVAAFGKPGFYNADDDYNLLYRWDWHEGKEHDLKRGEARLCLFYMLQRKAWPHSVHVMITRADEPAVRAWLLKKWHHLQRLWTPFAPDIPDVASEPERNELTSVHYAAEALRHG
jgi:hypothetical protein